MLSGQAGQRHRTGCVCGHWDNITFGWGGQAVASRCSCSEVWLQERRSEQQAERPSLFIREEMMLQPQPHIDVLISSPAVLGERDAGERRAASHSHFLVFADFPQWSRCFFHSVFHKVPTHRYSNSERWTVLSTVNIIRKQALTLIHTKGTWVGRYSWLVHFPGDFFSLTPLRLLYFYL